MASIFASRLRKAFAAVGLGVRSSAAQYDVYVPLITSGTGAPSASDPNGSLWLRTDGPPAYRAGSAWRSLPSKVSSNTAAGASLTNSTTETVLGSATVPASALVQGAVLRFRAKVLVTANNSTTTLTVRARLGATTLTGTALWTSTATDTSTNNIVTVEGELIARAALGASAAIEGMGTYTEPAAPGGAVKAWSLDATNFATNGALLLEITGQWSAADANACQLEHLSAFIG